jgi:hypothetical protein
MKLRLRKFWLPAFLDSGSSLLFIRRNVLDNIKRLGLPCSWQRAEARCIFANGEPCALSEVVILSIKIQSFFWKCPFRILEECPILCILGVEFMTRAQMCVDFSARRYSFRFHPGKQFEFEIPDLSGGLSSTFPCPQETASCLLCGSSQAGLEEPADIAGLVRDFPALFPTSWAPSRAWFAT